MVTYFTAINCDFKQHFRTGLHVTSIILAAVGGGVGVVLSIHTVFLFKVRCMYAPDYHPSSALGFTRREPREGDKVIRGVFSNIKVQRLLRHSICGFSIS